MSLLRHRVHAKFGGKCAYCGTDITIKQMQVDHLVPLMRGVSDRGLEGVEYLGVKPRERGTNDEGNLYPACAPCNRLKSSWTLEEFRAQVDWSSEALRRYDSQYRHLLRFKRIIEVQEPVVFWFETYRRPEAAKEEE